MGLLVEFIIFILTLSVCLFTFVKWKFSYWRKKNVPYIQPHFPFGTSENFFTRKNSLAVQIHCQYQYFKSLNHKCGGLYLSLRPSLLLIDIELIRNVISKDFQYFTDRGMFYNEKLDPISANLFNLEGHKWRHLRTKLTPTFTSGKIKMMFPTICACGEPLVTAVHELVSKGPVDIKDISSRFTTDIIGSCAFGLDCNSFKEPESDFLKYGRMVFNVNSKLQLARMLIVLASPNIAKYIGLTTGSPEPKKFFLEVVKKTVAYRKSNNVVRNDFIQLLMNLDSEDGEGLTIEQIAAQAFIFWFAGFETSSTAMTFCLYELATNQVIQNKAREEINTTLEKFNNELSYDATMEMKYLSQIIDETLRKYPPGSILPRICVENYQVPGTNITVEKGTRISIPVYALHHDPEYFPNPEIFDPDRFSDDNKHTIRPFTYMPFGDGPRNCIGLRFGLLQTKVGLILLLKNFKFMLNNKTQMPLKFDKFNFILSPEGGIWLDIEKVSK